MDTTIQAPILFTEGAIKEIQRLMAEDFSPKVKQLRIGVKGGGCSGMTYILEFDDKKDNDLEYESNGINYIINPAHEIYLTGMEIAFEGGLNSRGFTFNNPNASKTCGCGTSFSV